MRIRRSSSLIVMSFKSSAAWDAHVGSAELELPSGNIQDGGDSAKV